MHFLFQFFRRIKIRAYNRFVFFTTLYPGFPCQVIDKSSFLFMNDEIFWKEIYKFKTSVQTPYILDCGANIGLATIYFKRLFPQAEVVAFEPDPKIFEVLKKNIESAGVTEGVTCVKACLAATEGDVNFYPDDSDGGSMSHELSEAGKIKVPAITLLPYMKKPVAFLKIDIEGAEYEVLVSVKNKLQDVEKIFIEYHSYPDKIQHLDEILSIIKAAGFRYYVEHTGVHSPHPFQKIETYHNMDLQTNIFGYRI